VTVTEKKGRSGRFELSAMLEEVEAEVGRIEGELAVF
jgi:hypothetical protein